MCSRVDYDLKVNRDLGVNSEMLVNSGGQSQLSGAWSRGGLMRVSEEKHKMATKLF